MTEKVPVASYGRGRTAYPCTVGRNPVAPVISYRETSQRAAFLAGIAAVLALGIAQVAGWIVLRPRPYPFATHILIARTMDSSFPSDHVTLAFAIAACLWHYRRRLSIFLIGLAVALCFARVYVGTHFPLDTLGGALLGSSVGWGVGWYSSPIF